MDSIEARGPCEALGVAQHNEFSCAVIDLNYSVAATSGDEGLKLIVDLHLLQPELPVIVMTAWSSIDIAVRAMQHGASDFIQKPWDNARMIDIIRNQQASGGLHPRSRCLEAANRLMRKKPRELMFCESRAMRRMMELIRRVASSDANVLVVGEHGTGKGLVAHDIHTLSNRAGHPFIKVDMGSLSEVDFEPEMFGHVNNAGGRGKVARIGRFELADGGTLFLDEIANISLPQQVKLLRVVEDRELERLGSSITRHVDIRLVSTTNSDLDDAIEGEGFRKDLLYRLNTVQIRVPSLRERKEDILLLANHFLRHQCRKYRRAEMFFTPSAARALSDYDWPGNVRELEHSIERVVLFAKGREITASDLSFKETACGRTSVDVLTLPEAEEKIIRRALEKSHHNLRSAAESLGISRQALYRRLDKHGLRSNHEKVG